MVLAIDQGTSFTKACVVAPDGAVRWSRVQPHRCSHSAGGIVEQDAEEICASIESLIDAASKSVSDLSHLAIANQGETVIAWDRRTKKPLSPSIVWQDQRTQAELNALPGADRDYVTAQTGLPLDAYFSASKISWLLRNVPELASVAAAGFLGIGTTDAFFIDRLTGEYRTDVSTASRTSLMSLHTCEWDERLGRIFNVPIALLPQIYSSNGYFGTLRRRGREITLCASIVDQQAALYGHHCHNPGDAKITFGTGTFLLMNTGEQPSFNANGILPTVAWRLKDERTIFALDAGDYTAGAAVAWATNLGLAGSVSRDAEQSSAPTSAIERGLIFIPALAGLASPYWDRSAAGCWMGLRQSVTGADMLQAVSEGIALRAVELLDSMPLPPREFVSVDGGMTADPIFVQFLADALGRPVQLSESSSLAAMGAAGIAYRTLGHHLPPRTDRRYFPPSPASSAIRNCIPKFRHAMQASRQLGVVP